MDTAQSRVAATPLYADEIAAKELSKGAKTSPSPPYCFPALNFQPSTIHFGDQGEVSNLDAQESALNYQILLQLQIDADGRRFDCGKEHGEDLCANCSDDTPGRDCPPGLRLHAVEELRAQRESQRLLSLSMQSRRTLTLTLSLLRRERRTLGGTVSGSRTGIRNRCTLALRSLLGAGRGSRGGALSTAYRLRLVPGCGWLWPEGFR
jgi:hypothetical protein